LRTILEIIGSYGREGNGRAGEITEEDLHNSNEMVVTDFT
jgi:hypothetical protein